MNLKNLLFLLITFLLLSCSTAPLIDAVLKEDKEKVSSLLNAGENPNQTGKYCYSALFAAAQKGNIELVKLLLGKGADVNNKSLPCIFREGIIAFRTQAYVPLNMAKNAATAKVLIENGAFINVGGYDEFRFDPDHLYNPPLVTAIRNKDIELVEFLLSKGASTNIYTKDGKNRIRVLLDFNKAKEPEFVAKLEKIFSKYDLSNQTPQIPVRRINGVYKHITTGNKTTMPSDILYAIQNGKEFGAATYDYTSKRYLHDSEFVWEDTGENLYLWHLSLQANNFKVGDPDSNLLNASKYANIKANEEALEAGADINTGKNIKRTPLMLAAKEGHLQVVNLLIAKGADVNAKADTSTSAIFLTTNPDIVQALIKGGADVNIKTKYGTTPLMMATNLEIVKLLVENKADVNAKDSSGSSVLHSAVRNNNYEIVKYLIEKGANVNAKDNSGVSVLSRAKSIKNKNDKVIELLEKYGATP